MTLAYLSLGLHGDGSTRPIEFEAIKCLLSSHGMTIWILQIYRSRSVSFLRLPVQSGSW